MTKHQMNKIALNNFVRYYLIILVIFLVFILGIFIGRQTNNNNNDLANGEEMGEVLNQKTKPEFLKKDVDFSLFWEVWNIIDENYVYQPIGQTEMLYGAMIGSVASLGDPHSVFFDPEITQEFTEELQGSFEGIGAEIAIKNDRLTIVAPLPESPAQKAGLRNGDKVYAIDGEDTTGVSLDYAVSKIRGPKDTEVILAVSRDGIEDLEEIKIIRQTIDIDSVLWEMKPGNIAYLELRYFNEDTASDFDQAVFEIVSKNPKGIILDLRNNPGGFLETSILIASEWVEDGVVVYERASDGKLRKHKAEGIARLKDFKTLVLINEGSASASEIVAGALKDNNLAILMGETTFGKGTVQRMFGLDDGSSIKLTVAEWLTPNENTIEGQGIDPDTVVELTEEDFNNDLDPQLDKALEYFNQ
jgi:carboxyl-terminal processing protease